VSRPSRRHANIIKSRARFGYDDDQLARLLGITRETMRDWAKIDRDFAQALDAALMISRDYWQKVDEDVRAKFRR
jgi:DNA-binding XRE family transcriptional regulator